MNEQAHRPRRVAATCCTAVAATSCEYLVDAHMPRLALRFPKAEHETKNCMCATPPARTPAVSPNPRVHPGCKIPTFFLDYFPKKKLDVRV